MKTGKNIMKKRTILIALLVILFPLVVLFSHYQPSGNYMPLSSPKRSEQPQDTLVANLAIPIHHWKTSQDTPVYFIPTEKLQMLDIIITFDAGSARDGDKFGLASFHTLMLDEGTEEHSALQIAQSFENTGAIFDSNTDRDKMSIQLRTIIDPEHLLSTIDLLAEIIAKPNFSESSIQHLKKQTLVSLKSELQKPNIKALNAFYFDCYGSHPYGHLSFGTLEGVGKITRQDLIDFHKQYFVARNANITIVGGIHRDNAMEIAERITAVLPKGLVAPPLPDVQPLKAAVKTHIPLALQQTHVTLGQPCCVQNDPDFFSLLVGNYILGEGPFVSRLFQEIREQKGMVYSINSSFRRLKKPGPFMISLQTKANQASEAVSLVEKTLKNFIENGPTEEEVSAAKKGIIGGFPLSISSNAQIATLISEMTFYGLPNDYLDTFRSQVEQITAEDVQAAFQRRLNPDKMVMVVVGE
jgi:zinc protease